MARQPSPCWTGKGRLTSLSVTWPCRGWTAGLALIREAQRRQPGLPAILVTGYAGDAARLAAGTAIDGTFTLLRKPISATQLLDQVAALLSRPSGLLAQTSAVSG